MIKTKAEATAVQKRRAEQKKRGIAKAVRRWANRTNNRVELKKLPVVGFQVP